MIDPLFQPVAIGSLEMKNRIVMPPMHLNMCEDYKVTDRLIDFYRPRVAGGAGLVSVGYATVDTLSGNTCNIGAHDDRFLPGLARLAAAIKEGGARAAVQLNHAGRYNHSFFLGGRKPIAPSSVASKLTRETPRKMEEEDIAAVQQAFAEAAQRVVHAGFDMVEVLAGTGYLISEFLSPLTNNRTDQYGGCLENRMRFGLEVVRSVRSQIGSFPLLVRVNGNDFMEGGCGSEELLRFAEALTEAGVDGLSVNVGWHEARIPQIVGKVPRGGFAYQARRVRDVTGVPVIASHRINDALVGRNLIAHGFCDMVAMGRALIADPELPNKARTGREDETVHCVACGQGCFDNLVRMKAVECLCNPVAGRERQYRLQKTQRPQKILVAGGGPAGMYAALAARSKGHAVTLYEKSMRLGGQLRLAGASPGRREFLGLAEDLQRRLEVSGVSVILNREIDGPLLQEEAPYAVIAATGGRPAVPDIEGAEQDHVLQAWDVLAGRPLMGTRVVIIGGGAVGVETALMVAAMGTLSGEELKFLLTSGAESIEELRRLAIQGGKEVSVVEMGEKIGANFGRSTKWTMLQDVRSCGIDTRTGLRVCRIEEGGVVVDDDGAEELIPADSVVLAVGTLPHNPLEKAAAKLQILCKVAGDARKPATVLEAAHQGYRAGMGIS